MKDPIFIGSSVAIVTPFTNGMINYDRFHELIDWQIASGTSAITVCGTTGESSTLSSCEYEELLFKCVEFVDGRVKVIAGAGSNNTMHALDLCHKAEDIGVDGLLIVTPYYNKTTQPGLINHYTYIADRVKTPIIMYSVPSRTGMSLSIEALKILSQHPMINGLKDANSNLSQMVGPIAECGDNLNIWSGNDDETVALMSMGAKGVISVWANIEPDKVTSLTEACINGDYKKAAQIQSDAYELIKALFCETNPIPVKEAMNIMGLNVGDCRMPLFSMQPHNIVNLKEILLKKGLIREKNGI